MKVLRLNTAITLFALLLAGAGCSSDSSDVRLVLLLSVDTLRADRLAAYGSHQEVAPILDALSEESEVFTTAVTSAPFTLPSVVSMLTGLYPDQAGVYGNNDPLPEEFPTIATLLSENGWATSAVVSNYVLRKRNGLSRGFDRYDVRLPQSEAVRDLPERAAPMTTRHALEALDAMLAEESEKLFLWVHYQDPHGPYTPPREHRMAFLKEEAGREDGRVKLSVNSDGWGGLPNYQKLPGQLRVGFYRAGYSGEVHYMDLAIGQLIDEIKERGLWEQTIFAFTADHGESLGENDYWFSHGATLGDAVVRVPLFFRIPGRARGHQSGLAGLVDFLPTLAGELGLELSDGRARPGVDLLRGDIRSRSLRVSTLSIGSAPKLGVISDGHKLVLEHHGEETEAVILSDENDEILSAESHQTTIDRLRRDLEEGLRIYQARPRQKSAPLKKDEAAQLRALGYVD
jgi:arylsulfatase A-like enzyme